MNINGDFYTQNVRALIVDDLPSNLCIAETVFRQHGVEVVVVTSGEECIDKIQQDEFDIIFMDYMMPGMNGIDTVKIIRAMGGRYSSIPIVAFSSVDDEHVRKAFFEAGMNAVLSKPIIISQFRSILTETLPAGKVVPPQNP